MAATNHPAGIIDTDILIDATHRVPDALAFLAAQKTAGQVQISIVSAMELIQGCRNAVELRETKIFLSNVGVTPLASAASQTACSLMETFFLSHGLVIPDALIAATALELRLTLYSKNIRHYQMIPNLTVVRPY